MILGQQLYPKIAALEPDLSSKIIGMILELDNNEILETINNDDLLKEKIKDAKDFLREHTFEF